MEDWLGGLKFVGLEWVLHDQEMLGLKVEVKGRIQESLDLRGWWRWVQ
jgi:hypothetical protein